MCMQGTDMYILTIKESSLIWKIFARKIAVLCNESRIAGTQKLQVHGFWRKMKN